MADRGTSPDWSRVAAGFDLWLPQLAPVGETLLDALGARPGEHILDVACGTGEPALTLARRNPDLRVTAVDAAGPMVEVAAAKAAREGLRNVTLRTLAAEALDFPDASFDRIVCRFGVMLFADPLAGARQCLRVLRPGGVFAFAVWGRPEMMRNCLWAYEAFLGRVPPERNAPLHQVTSLGSPALVKDLAARAGFAAVAVEAHEFEIRFAAFDDYWSMVENSGVMAAQYEVMDPALRPVVREHVRGLAAPFTGPTGLRVPHEYLVAVARKAV